MTNKERAPITWTDFSALRWGGVDKPNSRMGKLKLHEFDLELGQAWHEASHALGIRIPMLSVPYTVKLKDKLYRTIY